MKKLRLLPTALAIVLALGAGEATAREAGLLPRDGEHAATPASPPATIKAAAKRWRFMRVLVIQPAADSVRSATAAT